VTPNVAKAVNYYQNNDFWLGGEDLESSFGNKTSNISNILYNNHNGETVHHTDIDNYLEDEIYNLIK
jgi:hypothetical protein